MASILTRGRLRILSCTSDHGDKGHTMCDVNYILESSYNFYYGAYYPKEPLAKNMSLKDLRETMKPSAVDQIRLLRKHNISVILYMSGTTMRTDSLPKSFVERIAQRTIEGKTVPTASGGKHSGDHGTYAVRTRRIRVQVIRSEESK